VIVGRSMDVNFVERIGLCLLMRDFGGTSLILGAKFGQLTPTGGSGRTDVAPFLLPLQGSWTARR
jgi:hypothetical protein